MQLPPFLVANIGMMLKAVLSAETIAEIERSIQQVAPMVREASERIAAFDNRLANIEAAIQRIEAGHAPRHIEHDNGDDAWKPPYVRLAQPAIADKSSGSEPSGHASALAAAHAGDGSGEFRDRSDCSGN